MENYFENLIREVRSSTVAKTLKVIKRQARTRLLRILNSNESKAIKSSSKSAYNSILKEIDIKNKDLAKMSFSY
jgi:hypothetical protein